MTLNSRGENTGSKHILTFPFHFSPSLPTLLSLSLCVCVCVRKTRPWFSSFPAPYHVSVTRKWEKHCLSLYLFRYFYLQAKTCILFWLYFAPRSISCNISIRILLNFCPDPIHSISFGAFEIFSCI